MMGSEGLGGRGMSRLSVIALLVTSLAVLTRLGAHEAEQRYPPAGEFPQIDGLGVHYTERTGVQLSLRPDAFLANDEDIRGLSDFLAVQSKCYGEISHPVLAVAGEEDHIVPAWNHAARLARQLPHMEHIELVNTGHALHHAHPERVADLVASLSRQLAATNPRASPTPSFACLCRHGACRRCCPIDNRARA
jgi:pimeloyl-ACP methyl ester carboxylesterase